MTLRQVLRVAAGIGFSVLATMVFMMIVSSLPGYEIPGRFFTLSMACAASVSAPVTLLFVYQENRIRKLHSDLERAYASLERTARTDQMTGIANRDTFLTRVSSRLASRDGWLIVADADDFKQINDTYGHPVGDRVIAAIGKAIRGCVRGNDLCGRLGGEEFGIFIDSDDPNAALAAAERIRLAVSALDFAVAPGRSISPTISLGFARAAKGQLDQSLRDADEALYAAKRSGRNRTVRHDPAPVLRLHTA
ncbi:GGDEF domain-containing protein [Novosphingobium aquimarinum]|uniref:GGDEF domain-containing protein n=1 Tax=Novosphingobium aquimarinum TaxID=2682494 RepID=UPI0012ECA3FA|nr:GGDEF domain-containing protein [Novosphingobium aquimarinum]